MKTTSFITVLIVLLISLESFAQEPENIILNSEFDSGKSNWRINAYNDASMTDQIKNDSLLSGKNYLELNIVEGGILRSDVEVSQGFTIEEGFYYDVSFIAKSSLSQNITVQIQKTTGDKGVLWTEDLSLSNTTNSYGPLTYRFLFPEEYCKLSFLLGGTDNAVVNLDSVVLMKRDDPDHTRQVELFEKRSHTYNGTTLPYRLLIPKDYNSETRYPLLLQLHGQTLGGTDNEKQISGGVLWADSANQAKWPCFVLAPQKTEVGQWADHQRYGGPNELGYLDFTKAPISNEMETVIDLLNLLIAEFAIDTNRIYITGGSSGGLGVYDAIYRFPHKFAAAMVFSAPCDTTTAAVSRFFHLPLWIIHGELDASIPCMASRFLVAAMERLGRECVYTHCNFHTNDCTGIAEEEVAQAIEDDARLLFSEWPGLGHQQPFWSTAYGYPLLAPWMFAQSKEFNISDVGDFDTGSFSSVTLGQNYPNPFNSVTTIPYELLHQNNVRISVYDLLGREVKTLMNKNLPAGTYQVLFNGDELAGDIYFYQIQTKSADGSQFSDTKKLILIK